MAGQQQGLKIATEMQDTLLGYRSVLLGLVDDLRQGIRPAAVSCEAEVEEREEREGGTNPTLSQTVSSVNQRAHLVFQF